MTDILIDRRRLTYGERDDHFRVHGMGPLPPKCEAGSAYLYLCVFADRLKIGVATDLYHRACSAKRIAGAAPEEIYFIRLERAEAFRRERTVCYLFSAWRTRDGRTRSEWLTRDQLPMVVMVMRVPEFAEAIRWVIAQADDFASQRGDPRFQTPEGWTADGRALSAIEPRRVA